MIDVQTVRARCRRHYQHPLGPGIATDRRVVDMTVERVGEVSLTKLHVAPAPERTAPDVARLVEQGVARAFEAVRKEEVRKARLRAKAERATEREARERAAEQALRKAEAQAAKRLPFEPFEPTIVGFKAFGVGPALADSALPTRETEPPVSTAPSQPLSAPLAGEVDPRPASPDPETDSGTLRAAHALSGPVDNSALPVDNSLALPEAEPIEEVEGLDICDDYRRISHYPGGAFGWFRLSTVKARQGDVLVAPGQMVRGTIRFRDGREQLMEKHPGVSSAAVPEGAVFARWAEDAPAPAVASNEPPPDPDPLPEPAVPVEIPAEFCKSDRDYSDPIPAAPALTPLREAREALVAAMQPTVVGIDLAAGRPWTNEEDRRALFGLRSGTDPDQIAVVLKRSGDEVLDRFDTIVPGWEDSPAVVSAAIKKLQKGIVPR